MKASLSKFLVPDFTGKLSTVLTGQLSCSGASLHMTLITGVGFRIIAGSVFASVMVPAGE